MRDNRVAQHVAITRLLGVNDRRPDARKIRVRDAAVLARPAIVARLTTVERLRQDRRSADGSTAVEARVDLLFEMLFAAGHLHRRLHDAVGELHQSQRFTADPGVALDLLVVGHHFFIRHQPIFAVAVVVGGVEVERRQAVALACPGERASAQLTASGPLEGLVFGIGIGVADIVDKPFEVGFSAGVLHALNRSITGDFGGRAAILEVVRPQVLREFGLGGAVAGFEQSDFHARLGKRFGNPPTGRARPHDHGVIGVIVFGDNLHGYSARRLPVSVGEG